MSLQGIASVKNYVQNSFWLLHPLFYHIFITFCSIVTASVIIDLILSGVGLCFNFVYNRQAKSQCNPSSLLMSSFEKVKPGINPRFFSQKIEANDPEKNMPSTTANAIILSPNVADFVPVHFKAQSAFSFTHGTANKIYVHHIYVFYGAQIVHPKFCDEWTSRCLYIYTYVAKIHQLVIFNSVSLTARWFPPPQCN